jgi:hypothetical protein
MKLTPNYVLGVSKLILLLILATALGAYMDYLFKGNWWTPDYWYGIVILIIACPVGVCLMFVPQYIVVDENGFGIKFCFRAPRYILFQDIYAFGRGGSVFLIQPNSGSTLQIYTGCFFRKIWKSFIGLINEKCPGKKAWFWVGVWAIR